MLIFDSSDVQSFGLVNFITLTDVNKAKQDKESTYLFSISASIQVISDFPSPSKAVDIVTGKGSCHSCIL